MTSEFVLRQQHKPKRPRRNDISVLRPSSKDLELLRRLKEFLPEVESLLKLCRDDVRLRTRARTHYVEKRDNVYVYRYLEVEDEYGNVVFRAKEDSPLAKEAEELVMLQNALRSICDALRTITHNMEFALRLQNKLGFVRDPENKLQSR